MLGSNAASLSRCARSSTRITEACWKSDLDEVEKAAASTNRNTDSGIGRAS
jgi:hypothetical protein